MDAGLHPKRNGDEARCGALCSPSPGMTLSA